MLKHNGSVVYRHDKKGVLQRLEHNVQLSMKEGHFYTADTPEGSRKVVSARGWEYIAAIAGLGFFKPPTIVDANGIERDNPVIVRRGSSVSYVRIREMLIARGENGNLRALDLTMEYDLDGALATKLFDQWMGDGQPDWGYVCNGETAAEEAKAKPRVGRVDIGGGNCLLYKLSEIKVLRILREHTSWTLMADRAATTLVERNLMRRFFGRTDCDEGGMFNFHSWVGADINWDDIKIKGGHVVVEGDKLSLESTEETTIDVVDEDGIEGGESLLPSIRLEAERVGGWRKARDLTKETCEKHGIRWGDLGATENRAALLDILSVLRNN